MHDSLVASLLWVGLLTSPPAQPSGLHVITHPQSTARFEWQTPAPVHRQAPRQRSRQQTTRRLVTPKLAGAFAGALGGMYLGGYLGAALDSGGGGDSPGLRGALVGMQIGGVTGALFGWKLVR